MKFFSAFFFAASVAFVSAQDLQGIPNCAIACFASAVPEAGCSLQDTTCQCTTGRDSITNSITSCVPSRCQADDIAKLAPAVSAICARAGVTVSNVPTAVPTSGASSSTGSATGSASTTAVSGTGSATSTSAPQNTGAANMNGVAFGAMAVGAGLVAIVGL